MNHTSIKWQLITSGQQVTYHSNQLTMNVTSALPTLETESNKQAYYEFYHNAQMVTGLICYPIICFLGLTGNIFILAVFSRHSMQTSTNVYLRALAVSDIIKLLNDVLYFFTVLLSKLDPPTGNKMYGYLYPYAHFVFNIAVCIAAWLTVSVAVERYILVCHPTKSKGVITISRAKTISIICYFVMSLLAIPSAFRYKTVTIHSIDSCGNNITELDVKLTHLWKRRDFVVSYTWMQSLLRSIIPLFILVVMNAFIINALRKTRANKKNASRNRITIMLIVVIIFFLCCITPDAIMSGFFNLGYHESENYLVKGIREITDMLLAVNAAINFVLYISFNRIFREQFLTMICKGKFKVKHLENGTSAMHDTTTISRHYTALQNIRVKGDATKEQHYESVSDHLNVDNS